MPLVPSSTTLRNRQNLQHQLENIPRFSKAVPHGNLRLLGWKCPYPECIVKGWWVLSWHSYFVFSFGSALNDKKKKKNGKGHKGSALITQRWRSRVQLQAKGNICDVTWPSRTIIGYFRRFLLLAAGLSNRSADAFTVSLRLMLPACAAWRSGEKATVWSVTTTEQTGLFEPPPQRHRPRKEAFKWHLFHSVALSGFKSVGSPEPIDISPADWSLKAMEVKGEQGARRPGVGTTRRDIYSPLCSRRERYQPTLRPTGTEWMYLVENVNTSELRLMWFRQGQKTTRSGV